MTPHRQLFINFKGMSKDLIQSTPNESVLYDVQNMRMTSLDEENFYGLINEKGTLKCVETIDGTTYDVFAAGYTVGISSVGNFIVVFSANTVQSSSLGFIQIFKLNSNNELSRFFTLKGNYEFEKDVPIETISYYENENTQKVYWLDGKHQLRMINIAEVLQEENGEQILITDSDKLNELGWEYLIGAQTYQYKYDMSKKVDITPAIAMDSSLYEGGETFDEIGKSFNLSVTKINSGGYFTPGIIQYALAGRYKNGQQTNLICTSPLYYITKGDERGLSPEEHSSCSFSLALSYTVNTEVFTYLDIYSIQRTSINGTPIVKKVDSLKMSDFDTNSLDQTLKEFTYIDDGQKGNILSDTDLIFLNKEIFSAGTMDAKNNTLFLGNIRFMDNIEASSIAKEKVYCKALRTKKGLSTESSDDCIWITSGSADSLEFKLDNSPSGKCIQVTNSSNVYPYNIQLNKSSDDITTFKYGEFYRFGIQLQDRWGHWSEPMWVGDFKNGEHPTNIAFYNNDNPTYLPYFHGTINSDTIETWRNENYIAIRPVAVFPTLQDMAVVCQGVLNPTVFNWMNRENSTAFSQASWCFRPNAPIDVNTYLYKYTDFQYMNATEAEAVYSTEAAYEVDLNAISGASSVNSLYGLVTPWGPRIQNSVNTGGEIYKKLAWCEFRHLYPLFADVRSRYDGPHGILQAWKDGNDDIHEGNAVESAFRGTELQSMTDQHSYSSPECLLLNGEIQHTNIPTGLENYYAYSSLYKNWFYVDQSIVTLNSPDITFNTDLQYYNLEDCKLRITGLIPITGNMNACSISVNERASWAKVQNLSNDFITQDMSILNFDRHAWKGWYSQPRWYGKVDNHAANHNIYLWQFDGTIGNNSGGTSTTADETLIQKYMSSLKFSNNTVFLQKGYFWESSNGYADIKYISETESTTKLKMHSSSGLFDIIYSGNVDQLYLSNKIVEYGCQDSANTDDYNLCFDEGAKAIDKQLKSTVQARSLQLKYKSTNHVVVVLNTSIKSDTRYVSNILPHLEGKILSNTDESFNDMSSLEGSSVSAFWDKDKTIGQVSSSSINASHLENGVWKPVSTVFSNCNVPLCGFLWLGELYNPSNDDNSTWGDSLYNQTRFGGITENALKSNTWIVAGPEVKITPDTTTAEIKWLNGDTYYQRYDCLKTYPYSEKELNMNVEILSFMCETHINIDGRYDKNRGLEDNLHVRPTNFNLLNDVYSQENNYFTGKIIDMPVDNFPHMVTWSMTKLPGSDIDGWSQFYLNNSEYLDGNKGKINKIINHRDNLIVFQDNAISQIYSNERTALTTEDGTPVQLSNSSKFDGYTILVNGVGCRNKWSICDGMNGLYFIDNNNKSIYLFSDKGVQNLSDIKGMNSWIKPLCDSYSDWSPQTMENFVSYNNRNTGDIYFINKDYCLAFNEILGAFSSFYSYNNVPWYAKLHNEYYFIDKDGQFWKQHAGDYNSFFGELKPFSFTMLANDESVYDKIFNTVDFESNSWKWDEVENRWDNVLTSNFKKITVWTEYQKGENQMTFFPARYSELKRKYRLWHVNIPRSNVYPVNIKTMRDRIRNPWAYIKLSSEDDILNTYKTILNNAIVNTTIV